MKGTIRERLIDYVRLKYGDELEYLWAKTPSSAIVRHKENNKWYAAIIEVAADVIGVGGKEFIDILDVKLQAEHINFLLDCEGFFPGYHMNKLRWITVLLDGTVDLENLKKLIDISYEITLQKPKKITDQEFFELMQLDDKICKIKKRALEKKDG